MISLRTLNTYISVTALGVLAGLASYFGWHVGILPNVAAFFPSVIPPNLPAPDPLIAAGTVIAFAVALSLAVTGFGFRHTWHEIAIGFIVVTGVCIFGSRFSGIDFLLVPLLFSGVFSLLLVQVNGLWSLDRLLVRTLFNSPITNSDPQVNADARLISGLKLLNTVLPLNEAVVFSCVHSDSLEAVARFKGSTATSPDTRRNSVWREGIKLCQQAAATGKLVSQSSDANSSTVAVPLLHEREIAGVLLVRLASDFSTDDTPLLEAVGSQFARNLKRESFSKNPARSQ
ncbi:MAG TPA: hypothetical protein VEV42_16110, partial [Pyrinomonadaceae bacterium]|nr:hypothetical protein [Pyrinomonadaceae bacterium]